MMNERQNGSYFPSLFGRAFIEAWTRRLRTADLFDFPSFLGGTFIEAVLRLMLGPVPLDFSSFSEGLSLRVRFAEHALTSQRRFPFLFGGTFLEAGDEQTLREGELAISLPFWKGFH